MLPINMEIHVLLFILEINLLCSDYLYNNYATHDTVLIQEIDTASLHDFLVP